MNCRNCGAPPSGSWKCAYCGTVDPTRAKYTAVVPPKDRDEAVNAIRALANGQTWAVFPKGADVKILYTPTPGQRMRY